MLVRSSVLLGSGSPSCCWWLKSGDCPNGFSELPALHSELAPPGHRGARLMPTREGRDSIGRGPSGCTFARKKPSIPAASCPRGARQPRRAPSGGRIQESKRPCPALPDAQAGRRKNKAATQAMPRRRCPAGGAPCPAGDAKCQSAGDRTFRSSVACRVRDRLMSVCLHTPSEL